MYLIAVGGVVWGAALKKVDCVGTIVEGVARSGLREKRVGREDRQKEDGNVEGARVNAAASWGSLLRRGVSLGDKVFAEADESAGNGDGHVLANVIVVSCRGRFANHVRGQ